MFFPTKYNFKYNNWGATPSATVGTLLTPGFNNVEGSWIQVASAANVTQAVYMMYMMILSQGGDGRPAVMMIDIGIDTAGGTNYTPIISNIAAGGSGSISNRGKAFVFPYLIPAGSSIAVRAQTNATSGAGRIAIDLFGQPDTTPIAVGTIAETIGFTSGSQGTTFTPNQTTYGSWTSLGTTSNSLWWWQLGINVDNPTVTGTGLHFVELAYGDVATKTTILKSVYNLGTNETTFDLISGNTFQCYRPLPAGSELWIRALTQNAPDTGFNATVIGIGG